MEARLAGTPFRTLRNRWAVDKIAFGGDTDNSWADYVGRAGLQTRVDETDARQSSVQYQNKHYHIYVRTY